MPVKLGTVPVNRIYLGNTQINRVYLGSALLFSPEVAINFTDRAENVNAQTSYNFPGRAIGDPAINRKVVVAIAAGASSTGRTATVTVGGIDAPVVRFLQTEASAPTSYVALYAAIVPTGTNADIAVNWSGQVSRTGVGLFRMLGAAASAHQVVTADTGSPLAVNIDVPARGGAIAVALNGEGGSVTWTGLNEDYDADLSGRTHSGAHATFSSAQSGLSVQAAFSQSPAFHGLVAASWASG
jgi:hypothetical protein